MSGFLSTVPENDPKFKPSKIQMTVDQLKDFMTQIEEKKRQKDWRKTIQIIKIIKISHASIELIEITQAEKFLRQLIAGLDCDPFSPDKQLIQILKTQARAVLQLWSERRRQKLVRESKERHQMTVKAKLQQIQNSTVSQNEDKKAKDMLLELVGVKAGKKSRPIELTDDDVDDAEKIQKSNRVGRKRKTTASSSPNEFFIQSENDLRKQIQTQSCIEFSPDKGHKDRKLIPPSKIEGTGMCYRDNLRRKLVNILQEEAQIVKSNLHHLVLVDLALRIETKMFQLYIHGKPYNDKLRSIIYNLTNTKNKGPLMAVLNRNISPEDFVSMDPRKHASDQMKKEREEAMKRGMHDKRTDWDQEVVKAQTDYKGMFQCDKCKSDKTGFIQIQIERADEPMTNFVFCYDCKHRYQMAW